MLVSYGGAAVNQTEVGHVLAFTTSGNDMDLLVTPSSSTDLDSPVEVIIFVLEIFGVYYGVIVACVVLYTLFVAIIGGDIQSVRDLRSLAMIAICSQMACL